MPKHRFSKVEIMPINSSPALKAFSGDYAAVPHACIRESVPPDNASVTLALRHASPSSLTRRTSQGGCLHLDKRSTTLERRLGWSRICFWLQRLGWRSGPMCLVFFLMQTQSLFALYVLLLSYVLFSTIVTEPSSLSHRPLQFAIHGVFD